MERAITVTRTNRLRCHAAGRTARDRATYAALVEVESAADRDESWQLGAAWNAGEGAKMLGTAP